LRASLVFVSTRADDTAGRFRTVLDSSRSPCSCAPRRLDEAASREVIGLHRSENCAVLSPR